jgi:hypothetical protein
LQADDDPLSPLIRTRLVLPLLLIVKNAGDVELLEVNVTVAPEAT